MRIHFFVLAALLVPGCVGEGGHKVGLVAVPAEGAIDHVEFADEEWASSDAMALLRESLDQARIGAGHLPRGDERRAHEAIDAIDAEWRAKYGSAHPSNRTVAYEGGVYFVTLYTE